MSRGPSLKARIKKYKAEGKTKEWLKNYARGWNQVAQKLGKPVQKVDFDS
jgi:hypothetical protein